MNKLVSGVTILAGLFFLSFGLGTNVPMPWHASVYIDDASRTYFAAPCKTEWEHRPGARAEALRFGTAREARRLKYKPDETCRNTGLHSPDGRSLGGQVLESIGVLPPLRFWWDEW